MFYRRLENMLLRAMVTESTMDDLLETMGQGEIAAAVLCDYGGDGGKMPMIMADVSQDRLLELAKEVQATLAKEYIALNTYDRLIVQSHKEAGGAELETAQAEICYWSYTDERLS